MKKKTLAILALALLLAAGTARAQSGQSAPVTEVGAPLSGKPLLDPAAASELFQSLAATDTVQTGFRAKVLEVCQMKGCWMQVELDPGQTVMVRFKDYGFFVPKDIAGSEVWVEGKAFVSEVSEGERRHLARDAGRTEQEVMAIRGPEQAPGFEASGVRIIQ